MVSKFLPCLPQNLFLRDKNMIINGTVNYKVINDNNNKKHIITYVDGIPLGETLFKYSGNKRKIKIQVKKFESDYCYFGIKSDTSDVFPIFGIVKRDYWNKHQKVDGLDQNLPKLPKGFQCLGPAVFIFDGKRLDAEKFLIEAGFSSLG